MKHRARPGHLLLCPLFVALFVFGDSLPSDARPAPVKKQCLDDSSCPEGQFCLKDYSPNRCTSCVDCSRKYRKAKERPDSCARTSEECGGCVEGFYERKHRCIPNPEPAVSDPEVSMVGSGVPNKTVAAAPTKAAITVWPWVVASVVSFVCVVGLTTFICNKHRTSAISICKRLSLTGAEKALLSGPSEEPSAPPADSFASSDDLLRLRQPAENPNFIPSGNANRRQSRPTIENSSKQQANPFYSGNSYGPDTANYPNIAIHDAHVHMVDDDDEVGEWFDEAIHHDAPAAAAGPAPEDAVVPENSDDSQLSEESMDLTHSSNPEDEEMEDEPHEVEEPMAEFLDIRSRDEEPPAMAFAFEIQIRGIVHHVRSSAPPPPPAPPDSSEEDRIVPDLDLSATQVLSTVREPNNDRNNNNRRISSPDNQETDPLNPTEEAHLPLH